MALAIESYGYLPQLFTFDKVACVPTAITNIMAAMARSYPSLSSLISATGGVTYEDLEDTRDELAERYFFTSEKWEPSGSPLSLVIEGLQAYAADRNLSQALEVEVIGPELSSPEIRTLGNFNKTKTVKINSPSRGVFEKQVRTTKITDPVISRSYRGGSVTIQDIQQALNKGHGLVLGLIYDDGKSGHAVSAVSLDWTDQNSNGIAESSENARLTIIDPLNPSRDYNPATPGLVDQEQRWNPLAEAIGPVRTTEVRLQTAQKNAPLEWTYSQTSVSFNNQTGEPQSEQGDSSNGTTTADASGLLTFAGILKARSTKRDIITGTSDDNVIELDPGRQQIKGGKGADAFVIGDADSMHKGQSDVIIDFKSRQGDVIVLSQDALAIDSIDLESVDNRAEKKLFARSDQQLVYHERGDTGILYLNSNGDESGWGSEGGELIRLKGSPELSSTDLLLS